MKVQIMRHTLYFILIFIGLYACSDSTQNDHVIAQDSAKNTIPKLSVQLWSIKQDVKKDIVDTLTQLASMGFDGVEFANEFGPYSENPSALKAVLDKLGLVGSGAHVSFEQLNDENFDKTVAFYKTLGIKSLIIGWDERAWSPDGISVVVNLLTTLSNKLSSHDMRIGFHNHQHEFNAYEDSTYWDYLAKNTTKNVILQLDVGWVINAGKDPVDYVKRYPGRTLTTHYKIYRSEDNKGKTVIIGEDETDWLTLLKTNIAIGGTQWIVLEQEQYPDGLSPIKTVAKSMQGLQKVIGTL